MSQSKPTNNQNPLTVGSIHRFHEYIGIYLDAKDPSGTIYLTSNQAEQLAIHLQYYARDCRERTYLQSNAEPITFV